MADITRKINGGGLPPRDGNSYNPIAGSTFPAGTIVCPATSGQGLVVPALADNSEPSLAQPCAIAVIPGVQGGAVLSRYAGPLTLTVEQWNQVTDTPGGLVPNAVYYVSTTTPGQMTSTQPDEGDLILVAGVALSSTSLMVHISTSSVSNGGGSGGTNTYQATASTSFPIGSVLCPSTEANLVDPAFAVNGSPARFQPCGFAATPGISSQAVTVQYVGPLTLTAEQWDAVTSTGGLVTNARYFVSENVPGRITTTRPTGGSSLVTYVGIALSPTTLMIQMSSAVLA
jgi:hypothetical protein